jgi:hypothetical protein
MLGSGKEERNFRPSPMETMPLLNTPVRCSPSGRFSFSTRMLVSSLCPALCLAPPAGSVRRAPV